DLPGNTMSLAQAREWIEAVEDKIGQNRGGIYSGNTAKEALGSTKDAFFGAHRLWLAQYSSTPRIQRSCDKYYLWQYSDGVHGPTPHGCPGVSGDVDTNTYDLDDAMFEAQWTGVLPDAPEPPLVGVTPTVTITTSGDVQVIVNGQVVKVTG